MNQELQDTLDRLRAIAKANPRPDTRPECPAVDGEVPPDRLVERVLMKEGRPSVNLLPNCKGPCIEGGQRAALPDHRDQGRQALRLWSS